MIGPAGTSKLKLMVAASLVAAMVLVTGFTALHSHGSAQVHAGETRSDSTLVATSAGAPCHACVLAGLAAIGCDAAGSSIAPVVEKAESADSDSRPWRAPSRTAAPRGPPSFG